MGIIVLLFISSMSNQETGGQETQRTQNNNESGESSEHDVSQSNTLLSTGIFVETHEEEKDKEPDCETDIQVTPLENVDSNEEPQTFSPGRGTIEGMGMEMNNSSNETELLNPITTPPEGQTSGIVIQEQQQLLGNDNQQNFNPYPSQTKNVEQNQNGSLPETSETRAESTVSASAAPDQDQYSSFYTVQNNIADQSGSLDKAEQRSDEKPGGADEDEEPTAGEQSHCVEETKVENSQSEEKRIFNEEGQHQASTLHADYVEQSHHDDSGKPAIAQAEDKVQSHESREEQGEHSPGRSKTASSGRSRSFDFTMTRTGPRRDLDNQNKARSRSANKAVSKKKRTEVRSDLSQHRASASSSSSGLTKKNKEKHAGAYSPRTNLLKTHKKNSNRDAKRKNEKKSKKNRRCDQANCSKKLGLSSYTCRCEKLYCSKHMGQHECTFDYHKDMKAKLKKQNPKVAGEKVRKL